MDWALEEFALTDDASRVLRAQGLTVLFVTGIIATAPNASAAQEVLRLPLKTVQPMPITTIDVGGQAVDVGIDTGGHGSIGLTRAVLQAAHAVELTGSADNVGNVYGESRTVRRFRVPEIRIGGRVFVNVDVIEAPEDIKGPPVKNGLGQEFLHQFVVLVDYPGRVITLLPPDASVMELQALGCDGTRVALERTSYVNLAISNVTLDGKTLRLLWDTGASYSNLPSRSAEAHGLKSDPDASGTQFYKAMHLEMGHEDFGPLEFVVLPINLPDEFAGLLGGNVFAKHRVCINYRQGEVRIR